MSYALTCGAMFQCEHIHVLLHVQAIGIYLDILNTGGPPAGTVVISSGRTFHGSYHCQVV